MAGIFGRKRLYSTGELLNRGETRWMSGLSHGLHQSGRKEKHERGNVMDLKIKGCLTQNNYDPYSVRNTSDLYVPVQKILRVACWFSIVPIAALSCQDRIPINCMSFNGFSGKPS